MQPLVFPVFFHETQQMLHFVLSINYQIPPMQQRLQPFVLVFFVFALLNLLCLSACGLYLAHWDSVLLTDYLGHGQSKQKRWKGEVAKEEEWKDASGFCAFPSFYLFFLSTIKRVNNRRLPKNEDQCSQEVSYWNIAQGKKWAEGVQK